MKRTGKFFPKLISNMAVDSFDEILKQRLLKKGTNHRELKNIETYKPTHLQIKSGDTKKGLINFASNDYLGLSEHQLQVHLSSQPSSRLLSGNLEMHTYIENEIAEWLGYEDSITFATGYMANLGLLSCIAIKGDTLLLDKHCHASLIDGAKLSEADFKRFNHLDYNHLEKLLQQNGSKGTQWVVTESLFSMGGDLPDVKRLKELKDKYHFKLIVDEAHGIGVYGDKGKGWFSEFYKPSELIDIFIFNFSKAFALQGGAVAGSQVLKEYIVNRCRTFIYTTATPAYQLEHIPLRLKQIQAADEDRKKLKQLCLSLQQLIGLTRPWSPIIPYHIGDGLKTLNLSKHIFEKGFYCPAILPPTVRVNEARLRISLNSKHEQHEIEALMQCLKQSDV